MEVTEDTKVGIAMQRNTNPNAPRYFYAGDGKPERKNLICEFCWHVGHSIFTCPKLKD